MTSIREKRKLERFELHAPAKIALIESGRKKYLEMIAKDISSAGAFLFSDQPFSAGANVQIEILLSLEALRRLAGRQGKVKVRVHGTVIRSDPKGIAVRFDGKLRITAQENTPQS